MFLNTQSNTAYIFNVGRGGTRHVTWDSPAGGERTLLEDFIETLRSINLKGYIVQGAMFSGESYNIFIDTEDEDWHEQIGCLG